VPTKAVLLKISIKVKVLHCAIVEFHPLLLLCFTPVGLVLPVSLYVDVRHVVAGIGRPHVANHSYKFVLVGFVWVLLVRVFRLNLTVKFVFVLHLIVPRRIPPTRDLVIIFILLLGVLFLHKLILPSRLLFF